MQRDVPGRHAAVRVVPLPTVLCLGSQHGAVHPPVRCPVQRRSSCAAAAVDGRGGVEHRQLWACGRGTSIPVAGYMLAHAAMRVAHTWPGAMCRQWRLQRCGWHMRLRGAGRWSGVWRVRM